MAIPGGGDMLGADAPRHVLVVPNSEEQLREQTSAWVAGGLAAGEQVSWFDDGTADGLLSRLREDGVAVEEPLRTGQLQIVPAEATRAVLRGPVEQVRGVLDGAVDAALGAGWRGLRFSGTLSHGLERPGGIALPEVDEIVDRVVAVRPARVMCVYDQARFPPWLIERMRQVHGVEAGDASVYDDALLRITRDPDGAIRLAGEVDHSNRQQVRRILVPLQDRSVRTATGPADLVMNLTSLRFCDVAAAVSVVHAAEELPSSHRLVLTGVRPVVERLLERCGGAVAPQLEIRPRQLVSSTR